VTRTDSIMSACVPLARATAPDVSTQVAGRPPTGEDVERVLSRTIVEELAAGATRLVRMPATEHAIPNDLARAPLFSPRRRGRSFPTIGREVGSAEYAILPRSDGSPGEPLPTDCLLITAHAVRLYADAGYPRGGLVHTSEKAMARALFGSTGGNQLRRVRELCRRMTGETLQMVRYHDSGELEEVVWHAIDLYHRDRNGGIVLRLPMPITQAVRRGQMAYLSNPRLREMMRVDPYAGRLWVFLESNEYPTAGKGWSYGGAYLETLLCIDHWPPNRRRETVTSAAANLTECDRRYRLRFCKDQVAGTYSVRVWRGKKPHLENASESAAARQGSVTFGTKGVYLQGRRGCSYEDEGGSEAPVNGQLLKPPQSSITGEERHRRTSRKTGSRGDLQESAPRRIRPSGQILEGEIVPLAEEQDRWRRDESQEMVTGLGRTIAPAKPCPDADLVHALDRNGTLAALLGDEGPALVVALAAAVCDKVRATSAGVACERPEQGECEAYGALYEIGHKVRNYLAKTGQVGNPAAYVRSIISSAARGPAELLGGARGDAEDRLRRLRYLARCQRPALADSRTVVNVHEALAGLFADTGSDE